MSILRNRFLNTASFLSGPDDPPNGGEGNDKPTVLNENVGAEDDTGTESGGEGDTSGETETEAGSASSGDDEDDIDTELADLPPEARAKAKAALQKRLAKETGWRDRQLDRLYRKNREKDENVRALEQIADPARRPAAKPGENLTAEQIEDRAKVLAGQMTAQERYDTACNDTDTRGRDAYGDKWKSSLEKLPKLGGVEIGDMTDIMSTEQPHVVLYQLSDPDTYDRVMSLPPARRRTEFVKLSLKEAPKPRKVEAGESKRPADGQEAPIRPINNGRKAAAQTVNLYDDKVPDEAWYAARNATRRKKFSDHV